MKADQWQMFGLFWNGKQFERITATHRFAATVIMDKNGKFSGRMEDEFGFADIIRGHFKDDVLIFSKKYELSAQRRGASRALVRYQFMKTQCGGWYGRWEIHSKLGNTTGHASMAIL